MKIAFLGDSITLGYGLEHREDRYSTRVCEMLGVEEENFGITGTLMARAGLNEEDGKDFLSRASLVEDADLSVVFGGTNDYFWSNRPIRGEDDGCFEEAVRSLLSHLDAKRQGRLVLFITPYPHNGIGNFEGGSHWKESSRHDTDERNYNGHTLKEYADVILRLCEDFRVPCLSLFEDFGFRWQDHTLDGCHPNPEGHALIARAVVDKLKSLSIFDYC